MLFAAGALPIPAKSIWKITQITNSMRLCNITSVVVCYLFAITDYAVNTNKAMLLKTKIKSILTSFFCRNPSMLKEGVEKHQVISFDLFETLVFRDVQNEEALYAAVASELGYDDSFRMAKDRTAAELALRDTSEGGEPTLKEVYSYILDDPSDVAKFVQKEEELNIAACSANKQIIDIYNDLYKQRNSMICITSDTTLAEDTIKEIIKKCGIEGLDYLFLSSSLRATKRRGTLFAKLRNECGAEKIIHVGNDFKADFLKPTSMGINSFLINSLDAHRMREKTLLNRNCKPNKLNAFIANHKVSHCDIYFSIGYEILGPLLYAFSTWLHEESRGRKVFLSREGRILRDAYVRLFPEEEADTRYFHASRRAVIGCNLHSCKSMSDVLSKMVCISDRCISGNDLLELGLISVDALSSFSKAAHVESPRGINFLNELNNKDISEAFDKCLLLLIQERSKTQSALFNEYFESCVGKDAENISIVDVGWRGSMQDGICEILQDCEKRHVEGYYFGVYSDSRVKDKRYEAKHGLLFEDLDTRSESFYQLTLTGQFFEMLFLGNEGTTSHYELQNGIASPVLEENELDEQSREIACQIKKAAIQFIDDYRLSEISQYASLQFGIQDAFDNYTSIALTPPRSVIDAFRCFDTENVFAKPLFGSKGFIDLLLRPHTFMEEFKNSYCKVFYMKRAFGLPLPFYKMLRWKKRKEEEKRLKAKCSNGKQEQ